MFFKSKLQVMGRVVKEHIKKLTDKWQSEIAAKGETRFDLNLEFERLFAHVINHICFGADHNDDRFDFEIYDKATKTFTMKKASLREALTDMIK
jgi:cytochrome P450